MCAFCIPAASAERLLCAVPKTPAKSSVPPRLPLHKNRPLLTRSESTLPHLLIPRHFNSPGINTYKKPGRGSPSATPKFCNSSPKALANRANPPQLAENTAALYPASANLDIASSLTPLFATLTENTRVGVSLNIVNREPDARFLPRTTIGSAGPSCRGEDVSVPEVHRDGSSSFQKPRSRCINIRRD
jgi:hypothetical protein